MITRRSIRGGTPLLLALVLLAAPMHADGPEVEIIDWLGRAQAALAKGDPQATRLAVRALRAKPMGAQENLHTGLSLFWMGQFEDSARYVRRALSIDASAIADMPVLSARMPAADVSARLNQLGKRVDSDTELCFLAGALLLANQQRRLALPFLVRAEELAGTDAQAARLTGAPDRSRERGLIALRKGEWADAATAFAFAALDTPGAGEHYAGMALALAANREFDSASQMLETALARISEKRLVPWLIGLELRQDELIIAARELLADPDAAKGRVQLAVLLAFTCGYYMTANEAALRVLTLDRLDGFALSLLEHMREDQLTTDPAGEPEADAAPAIEPKRDQPDAPAPTTIEQARRLLRSGDFDGALKALDPFVKEPAEPEIFRLLFVVLVGRGELSEASMAMQTWFSRAPRSERVKLNAIRDLFGKTELFDAWRRNILDVRNADPNAGTPRLLNAYVELTRGRYQSARDDLVVAKIESPANATVLALEALLLDDSFKNDATPNGVRDDPSPKALYGRAEQLFKAGDYAAARSALLQAAEVDPKLPYVHEALLRCTFALGDFTEAARKLVELLAAQSVATGDASKFRIHLADGYTDNAEFQRHVDELRKLCTDQSIAAAPFLLLGAIEFDQRRYREAAAALQKWSELQPGERSAAAMRLLEYARKNAG
jgi:tetratricopeptide (TPR) repeat protein